MLNCYLSMKDEKRKLEKSLSEMESRASELAKSNSDFLTQVFFLFIFLCSLKFGIVCQLHCFLISLCRSVSWGRLMKVWGERSNL